MAKEEYSKFAKKLAEREFTNNRGESLRFIEIITKDIISVEIACLSEAKREQVGFRGRLGFYTNIQNEKKVIITGDKISLKPIWPLSAVIYFSSREDFERIKKERYDRNTLYQPHEQDFHNFDQPTLYFPLGNIVKIDWN